MSSKMSNSVFAEVIKLIDVNKKSDMAEICDKANIAIAPIISGTTNVLSYFIISYFL